MPKYLLGVYILLRRGLAGHPVLSTDRPSYDKDSDKTDCKMVLESIFEWVNEKRNWCSTTSISRSIHTGGSPLIELIQMHAGHTIAIKLPR